MGIGIGIHYGAVVVGNAGADRRLDFTAVGSTVNLAARLERLTREIDTDLVVSEEACRRAGEIGCAAEIADLMPIAPRAVRGRSEPVALQILQRRPAAEEERGAQDADGGRGHVLSRA